MAWDLPDLPDVGDLATVVNWAQKVRDSLTYLKQETVKAIFAPFTTLGTGAAQAANGNFSVVLLDAATEQAQLSFQVPNDFGSLSAVKIAIIPTATGTFDWTAYAEQLDNGEATGTITDSATADGQAATNNTLLELDITAAFNGLGLAAGDWVGLQFILDVLTTTTAIGLVGISFQYTATM